MTRYLYFVHIFLFTLFLHPAASQALQVSGRNTQYAPMIEELVQEVLLPNFVDLPLKEQNIISDITIVVTNTPRDPITAFTTIENGQRKIIISDGFIEALRKYVMAFSISKGRKWSFFREWYFDYFFHRQPSRLYIGELKDPFDYAQIAPSDQSVLKGNLGPLFGSAVLDVILHEVGHHVTNSFYTANTPNALKRQYEERADAWADQVSKNHLGGINILGRVLAVGYALEFEKWVHFSNSGSHPKASRRSANGLSDLCDSPIQVLDEVCAILRDEVENYFALTASTEELEKRVKNGEIFAKYKLGSYMWHSGSKDEGCRLVKEAFQAGMSGQAALYYGFCVEYGHISEIQSSQAKAAISKMLFRSAARSGFQIGCNALRRLGAFKTSDQKYCPN